MQSTFGTEYPRPAVNALRVRLFAAAMIVAGVAGWWYNWHLAATEGQFYIKLCIFGPLAVFGGFLVLIRPEWVGPVRSDSSVAHKIAIGVVIALMAVFSGLDMYLLMNSNHRAPQRNLAPPQSTWSPDLGTPSR